MKRRKIDRGSWQYLALCLLCYAVVALGLKYIGAPAIIWIATGAILGLNIVKFIVIHDAKKQAAQQGDDPDEIR